MEDKKIPLFICLRCEKSKPKREFPENLSLIGVCQRCYTTAEVLDYIQPEITKLMRRLTIEKAIWN